MLAALKASVDVWDVLGLLGLALLVAGVYLWFGIGPALTVGGALVLVVAVLGGLNSGDDDEESGG
ncbi:hypothetical protein [Amycolatopsis palatopharyngis]|uniref:hypothetical protein n=1 Tax=Amycolatopsis palatopharyngis TaxID=187982 RepID=UPI001B876E8D|nr:hypothetical protein [Amycolatopsis palatopharyngis]